MEFSMPIRNALKFFKKNDAKSTCICEIQVNLAILGSSHSGKTSLVKRFLCRSFSEKYNPTLMDVFEELYVLNVADVGLLYRIFDLTGSDEFPAMRQVAISSAESFIIVYAVDDRKSFEDAKQLRMQIEKIKGQADVPIILIANKCDVDKRKHAVSSEEGKILGRQWGCQFMETSAKSLHNIDDLFIERAIEILKQKCPELTTLHLQLANTNKRFTYR